MSPRVNQMDGGSDTATFRQAGSAVIESSGQEEITLAQPFILYHLPVRSDKQSYALVDLKALRFEKVCPGQHHMARVYRTVSYGPGGVPVSHRLVIHLTFDLLKYLQPVKSSTYENIPTKLCTVKTRDWLIASFRKDSVISVIGLG
ncbi:hypothetical protein RRG08_011912 [Elysia crispata]|uniref:Uncharacterized protein n=1 Tax=Elysia crispata TaxID=231223 RepID=A0AAE0ZM79_9GAST|nr:hypothetical protein RRG08_011912 [Elysia crispata]